MKARVAFEGLFETKREQIDYLKKKVLDPKLFKDQESVEIVSELIQAILDLEFMEDDEFKLIREVASDEIFYDFTELGYFNEF